MGPARYHCAMLLCKTSFPVANIDKGVSSQRFAICCTLYLQNAHGVLQVALLTRILFTLYILTAITRKIRYSHGRQKKGHNTNKIEIGKGERSAETKQKLLENGG
jgi:hypothetical protein